MSATGPVGLSAIGGIMQYTTPSNYRGQFASGIFLLVAVLLTAAMAAPTLGQPGSLDPTFDGDGKRVDPFIPGGGIDGGNSVLIQPDGKIVTVGTSTHGNSTVCSATRHLADGTLDPGFGASGKVLMGPAFSMSCSSAALQTDGKIVAVGTSGSYPNTDFAIARYNPDGSLDTTLDSDGKVTTDISGGLDAASAVAIQTDGKIVVAGIGGGGFALARYNINGSLDPSFDGDGKLTTWIRDYGHASAVAIQTDGKIVVAGSTGYDCTPCPQAIALMRYNSDGSLDTTFDGDGIVITQVGFWDAATSVAIQSDGKIVAGGSIHTGPTSFAVVVRYSSDGSLDVTFDGGIVTTPIGTYNSVAEVTIQPDGRIVAAGHVYNGSTGDFALVRYNTNGSLDATFDGDGIVTTSIGTGDDGAGAVALQPDGKIVAAGFGNNTPTDSDFALARYNPNGSLDTSGFNGGIVLTDIGHRALSGRAVVVQPDGKIITGGLSYNGAIDFALVRYNSDGTRDTTFDGDGLVTTPIGTGDDFANAVALQPDGKIIAAGSAFINGSNRDFAVVRYNGDGSLDTTFDGDGLVTTPVGSEFDEANAVAIQPDGKIVIAGYSDNGSNRDFALVRYNTNGSLDTTFDGDGIATTNISTEEARAVVIQTDGKIVAAGRRYVTGGNAGFVLVRYNTNGSLDTTFDGDGIVTTQFYSFPLASSDGANAVGIQSDRKIVVAGTSYYNGSHKFALARYNPDGSLDQMFNWSGFVTTPVSGGSEALAVAVQSDRRIVAAGLSWNGSNAPDFALVRYNTNGSPDTTFGGGDGNATVDFNSSYDSASGMALDGQGRAVVVGGSDGGLAVVRFFLSHRAPFDFDGDGRSDVSVFRPSDSIWYLDRSRDGFAASQFGIPTDKLTPADYDGDGKTDISVFRDGTWWRINSGNSTVDTAQFGIAGDIPVPGDYNGDGRDELAVYRNGEWWREGVERTNFGLATDKPVPADYDGDGKTDIAIYRDGVWWRINSSNSSVNVVQFGIATDRPVVGDYDGDSKADLAVYRDGTWHILQTTGGYTAFNWGLATDTPTPADYDGDGKADAAVYRGGAWYLLQTTSGVEIRQFGLANDKPVASAYLH